MAQADATGTVESLRTRTPDSLQTDRCLSPVAI